MLSCKLVKSIGLDKVAIVCFWSQAPKSHAYQHAVVPFALGDAPIGAMVLSGIAVVSHRPIAHSLWVLSNSHVQNQLHLQI